MFLSFAWSIPWLGMEGRRVSRRGAGIDGGMQAGFQRALASGAGGVFSMRRRQGAAGATRGGHSHSPGWPGTSRRPSSLLCRRRRPDMEQQNYPDCLRHSSESRALRIPEHWLQHPSPWARHSRGWDAGGVLRGTLGRVTFPGPPVPAHTSVALLCPAGTERAHLETRVPLFRSPAGTFHIPQVLDCVQALIWVMATNSATKQASKAPHQSVPRRSEGTSTGRPRWSRCHRSRLEPSFVSPDTLTPFTFLLQSRLCVSFQC